MTTPLITLCAIVGNEEAVIERFIRSFAPACDQMVFFVATGNQDPDKTSKIARQTCQELGVQVWIGEYENTQQWPHVDHFGDARNETWRTGSCPTTLDRMPKYLIWADADDLLPEECVKPLRTAAESGEVDVYIVAYEVRGKSQIVHRERMVRNDGCSRWRYPIHESLEFTRDVTYRVLRDVRIVHAPLPQKDRTPGRNRRILDHAAADGARNLFYIAQELFELNNETDFKVYAKAALAHPSCELLERYELLLNLAQVCNTDTEQAKTYAAQAYNLMPDRREALALLASYALVDKRYDEAHSLAKHMATLPMPSKTYWTLNRDWYTWKGFYLLTHTLRRIGKEQGALRLEQEEFQKAGGTFSICHPTYLRPEQALAVREMWIQMADKPMNVEYIFGIHHDDKKSLEMLSGYRHTVTDKEGCCPNTLEPFRSSTGKFIMVVADDLLPCQGWDTKILEAIHDGGHEKEAWHHVPLVLNFKDGIHDDDGHMCHAMMTRPYMEEILKDPWPGTGIWSDTEFTHRARKAGIVIESDIYFEHRHYSTGKVPIDETYYDQNKQENYDKWYDVLIQRNPGIDVSGKKEAVAIQPIDVFPLLVETLMRKKGQALDFMQIGAHDGKSNDALFDFAVKHQWRGVLVEPQPELFKRLVANYAECDQVKFENVAVANKTGTAKLHRFKPGQDLPDQATMLASFTKDALKYNGFGYAGEIEEIEVPAVTLGDLLLKHGIYHLDILQIDAEGYDFEILKMLRETNLRPTIIRFEHAMFGNTGNEARQLLAELGYRVSAVGIDSVAYLEGA